MPRACFRRLPIVRAFADGGCAVEGALPKRTRMVRAGHDDRRQPFRQPFR